VTKAIGEPRLPTLKGKIKARNTKIEVFDLERLNVAKEEVGLSGSLTRVVKIFYPKISRVGKKIRSKDPEEAANLIIEFLEERGIL
ncbi:MAG: electron transfer flavoprotein subunit beta, partial [bacterium]